MLHHACELTHTYTDLLTNEQNLNPACFNAFPVIPKALCESLLANVQHERFIFILGLGKRTISYVLCACLYRFEFGSVFWAE